MLVAPGEAGGVTSAVLLSATSKNNASAPGPPLTFTVIALVPLCSTDRWGTALATPAMSSKPYDCVDDAAISAVMTLSFAETLVGFPPAFGVKVTSITSA